MTDPELVRFLNAQDRIYQQVFNELAAGRKETRSMRFIFPQLAGLWAAAWPSNTRSAETFYERRAKWEDLSQYENNGLINQIKTPTGCWWSLDCDETA
jgi:Protein of unknown function (DUF1810)